MLVYTPGKLLDEMAHQGRNIRPSFAQRGHPDGEHVEPVVQVIAKFLFRDRMGQIAVGGGNQTNVYLDGARAAQALEFMVLAQLFRLQLQRNVTTSSRNELSLSTSSRRPTFWLMAPVKAPFSWPKNSLSWRKPTSGGAKACGSLLARFQVAAPVAVALDNARSYREIAQLTDKLASEKLYLEEEIRSELNFEERLSERARR